MVIFLKIHFSCFFLHYHTGQNKPWGGQLWPTDPASEDGDGGWPLTRLLSFNTVCARKFAYTLTVFLIWVNKGSVKNLGNSVWSGTEMF